MIRRRATYNPLQPSSEARWLTIRAFTGTLLESTRLDPGTDLERTFLTAMLELKDAGWQLGEFSSTAGTVRHTRGTQQRMLSIEAQDPDGLGRSTWGGQCVNCED